MDLSAVKQRYGKVPPSLQKEADEIWSRLQEQKEFVISAKATMNFAVDDANSKIFGSKVHRGVIVGLKPGYKISSADSWIHPNLNQCRSLYDGGSYCDHYDKLPSTDCSAGVYTTQAVNEIGDIELKPHTVVDLHLEDAPEIRKSWNDKLIESVYSTTLRDRTLEEVNEVAMKFGAQDKIRSDFTNVLYRGRNMFFFYNNAFKGEGLVLSSPLTGYSIVNAEDHAADYMSKDMIDVPDLKPMQVESMYKKAYWNTAELVNTFVTKKSFSATPVAYRLQRACFSDTPVIKYMSPTEILNLTPLSDHVPNKDVRAHEYLQRNELRIPLTRDVMDQLLDLKDEVAFLNPKYYREGKLLLPRHIVGKLM